MAKDYILHIASWFPNTYSPFNGDFVERHINCLKNHTNIVVHAHIDLHKQVAKKYTEQKQSDNYKAYISYQSLTPFRLFAFAQKALLTETVNRAIQENGTPKLIQIHVMSYASMLIPYLKSKFNVPIVIIEHSTIFSKTQSSLENSIKVSICKSFSKKADLILTVSKDLKNHLSQKAFKPKLNILHNVVPNYFFKTERTSSSGHRFLHVSSLKNDHKNVLGILKVFQQLNDTNSTLSIIGNDNHKQIAQWAEELKIEKNKYSIKGPLSHKQIASEMANHDTFVLFSNYENYPCVLIEAQASGMRLIATDVGGVSEIIGPEDHLIQARNEQQLLDAMRQICAKDNLEINDIRRKAKEKYDEAAIEKQLENYYQTVLKD